MSGSDGWCCSLFPFPPGREAASGQSWLLMDVSLTAALKGGQGWGRKSRSSLRSRPPVFSGLPQRPCWLWPCLSLQEAPLSARGWRVRAAGLAGTQALPGHPLRIPAAASFCHTAVSRGSSLGGPPPAVWGSRFSAARFNSVFLADTPVSDCVWVVFCSGLQFFGNAPSFYLPPLLPSSTRNGKTDSSLLMPWSD